ncbi:hypothetical protein ACA910_002888 [Epithemia clementina (nom. ined.)]
MLVADSLTEQALQVEPIRAFQDNYIWLLTRAGSNIACVVDPGDAEPVISVLEARGLNLGTILLTHHHADHVGGVKDLLHKYRPTVYGPANSRIEGIDIALHEGDRVQVMGCDWQVLEVPGHTMDHIAYFTPQHVPAGASNPLLFCGDTLFASGCGRMFEGTPPVMLASLQKLAALPEQTLVYCVHEYTLANIRFALAAEPENPAITEQFMPALIITGCWRWPLTMPDKAMYNALFSATSVAACQQISGLCRCHVKHWSMYCHVWSRTPFVEISNYPPSPIHPPLSV